ncbi:MAG: hypothetical protein N2C14_27910, partial [Planctomycetales bacterium]
KSKPHSYIYGWRAGFGTIFVVSIYSGAACGAPLWLQTAVGAIDTMQALRGGYNIIQTVRATGNLNGVAGNFRSLEKFRRFRANRIRGVGV